MSRSRGIGRPKGFRAVAWMQKAMIHGGNSRKAPPALDRSAPDAMAVWRDSYLDYLAARNYSAATIDGRYKDINIFLTWAADRDLTRAGQITRPILETYQLWTSRYTTAKGKRISWSAHYKRLCTLKHWFRWMTRQNVIINNPASELEMPRTEKRLPTVGLTLSEIGTLMGVPDVLDLLGVRDRAMLEIFYSCGLRRSELCRLDLPDFNAERRTLHIRQGKGHRDRMVPVGEQAVHWIGRYLEEVRPRLCLDTRTQAIFLTGYGGPFNPDVVSRMMTRWMQRAGLGGKGSCHLLRHTCATHMLEGGADIRYIQQLLGHAKLETTAIYTEVSIRQLQEVHARCHPSGRAAQAAATVPQ